MTAAGPAPRTTIASISPGAAPDTFRRVMPASSVVRSLATVSAAITSSGHRLQRIECAVRAIVAAAPISAHACATAMPRPGRCGVASGAGAASIPIPWVIGAPRYFFKARPGELDAPRRRCGAVGTERALALADRRRLVLALAAHERAVVSARLRPLLA